ncbi:hypothetical protein JS533_009200 [Bifidobacterium amazonense]|uniref:Uncharacterized protein n=1 Tax=Bifidobacterium amazonense TaxID=2809027 RepID=A0ABS9VWT9_9BIFI|nr:hypothetical protein [Bifidobacterium amazonense]MCH9276439.1 hypothetical protein [Bifidobacterium amazonense]
MVLYRWDDDGVETYPSYRKALNWLHGQGHEQAEMEGLRQAVFDGSQYCGYRWSLRKTMPSCDGRDGTTANGNNSGTRSGNGTATRGRASSTAGRRTSQHATQASFDGRERREGPVEQIDPLTLEVVASYDSAVSAAEAARVLPKMIRVACRRQMQSAGYLWRWKGDKRHLATPARIGHGRVVCRTDRDGNVLEVYPSLMAAAESIGSQWRMTIAHAIENNRSAGGYWWRYLEE